MEEASRDTVRLLLSCVSQYAPRDGERPQPYLLRLSESLIFEFLGPEFPAGALTAVGVRPMLHRLGGVLVNAGRYAGPHASAHLSSFAMTWSTETYREKLVEKFWLELAAAGKIDGTAGAGRVVCADRGAAADARAVGRDRSGCATARSAQALF